jgi:hypothetical protein
MTPYKYWLFVNFPMETQITRLVDAENAMEPKPLAIVPLAGVITLPETT